MTSVDTCRVCQERIVHLDLYWFHQTTRRRFSQLMKPHLATPSTRLQVR